MTTLTQAHRQWASRPADERFTSLTDMQAFAALSRQTSRSKVVSTREIELIPDADDYKGLLIGDRDGTQAVPTHWSFGQLCSLAATPSPASYFRESGLPTPIIADCLNYNLRFTRGVEDVKLLVSGQGADVELRAATGPRYGRIWNADVVDALVERFGDGVSGGVLEVLPLKRSGRLGRHEAGPSRINHRARHRGPPGNGPPVLLSSNRDELSHNLSDRYRLWDTRSDLFRFGGKVPPIRDATEYSHPRAEPSLDNHVNLKREWEVRKG
jgi:hypothetical protein